MSRRVFALAGAKGGVGKTTTALNLAAALATAGHAVVVVEQLRSEYEAVLIDTPAGATAEALYPVRAADATVVVSTPRAASVRDADKTIELIERVEGTIRGVVFTRTGSESTPAPARIAEFLGVDLVGEIPEDGAIPDAQEVGHPVTEYAPDSAAAAAYREIAARLGSSLGGVAGEGDEESGIGTKSP